MKSAGDGKGNEYEEVAASDTASLEPEKGISKGVSDAAVSPAKKLVVNAAEAHERFCQPKAHGLSFPLLKSIFSKSAWEKGLYLPPELTKRVTVADGPEHWGPSLDG